MLSRWRFWCLDILIWSLLAFVTAATWHMDLLRRGQASDGWHVLRASLLETAPWVLITAGVFFLVGRIPWRRQHWLPVLAAYVGGTAVLTLIYLPVRGLLQVWLLEEPLNQLMVRTFRRSPFEWFFDGLLLACLFAIATAVFTAETSRRRQRRAATLALQNARLENELNDAKLQMLRAQLEPHFLHNALNAVTALIRCGEPEAAVEALSQLSDLLRFAAGASQREMVTVAEEMHFAETYLRFQQLRFGDRLHSEIELDDAIEDVEIPPLLLQPMLENAIHHGVESSEAASRVRCTGHADGAELCFVISNSPSPEVSSSRGLGIGLENTRRRLAAHYGDRFELEGGRRGDSYIARLCLRSTGSVPAGTVTT